MDTPPEQNNDTAEPTPDWLFPGKMAELALERLLDLIGQPADPERVRMVAWSQEALDNPWEQLRRSGEALGLRFSQLKGTLDDVVQAAGPEITLVAYTTTPEPGWMLIRGRSGPMLELESQQSTETQLLTQEVVASLVGLDSVTAEATWFLVTAAEPLAGMSSESIRNDAMQVEFPKGKPAPPMARLKALFRTEQRDIGVVLVFAVAVGLLTLVTPVVMQVLVNTVAFGTPLQPLVVLTILLLGGLGFAAALRALETWVVEMIQRRIFLRLVGDLAHRLPRVQAQAFDKAHGPELVNRFFDVFTVKKVSAWLLLEGMEILLTVVIGMLVLAFYHPILLAFDVILVVCVLIIVLLLGRGGSRTAIKESKAKYAVAGWLEELVRHPNAFKITGGSRFGVARTDALARKYLKARHAHFRIVFRQIIGTLALQALATTSLIAIGAWLVMERQLTLGQLVAAELIVSIVVASLIKLSRYFEQLYDLIAAIDKLGQLVDLPLERSAGHACIATDDSRGASLRLHNVTFGFPKGATLLKGVNLELEPGERVVVTGPAGSGKSALLHLLFGLRKPQKGHIELDGLDLREVGLGSLRDRVAVIYGPEIFEGTVFENIPTLRRASLTRSASTSRRPSWMFS
ncbi:MAG: ATP-binding cassette domain-containing protein, partial [Myxococcota bacterium]